ncbi:hypothetical protein [Lacinutrix sp. 5H-3-7-4]|uniref:hypothetical protein n=1 Tax=Lacinutrix sp. (strain 5H-3-7-4) TaxID=983544 RepID=UPI000305EC67|nr:hypothetical protein [Lacinutrix sp. 5H-3-7-4]
MKFLTTLLLVLFVSFASAQDNKVNNKENTTEIKVESQAATQVEENTVVISVKGIKTMEEIDIENYNKTSLLKLIASSKQKPKMC